MTDATEYRVTVNPRPKFRRYIIPANVVNTVESWFQEAGRLGVEDIAIIAGYATTAGDAIGITALHPNAAREAGWYEQRDGPDWGALYTFAHEHGMHYLLQIHTHPHGCSTRHSRRDDVGAFSDETGFLSIVVPDFARGGLRLSEHETTIHERVRSSPSNPSGWRVWTRDEVRRRLRVIPEARDYQPKHRARPTPDRRERSEG